MVLLYERKHLSLNLKTYHKIYYKRYSLLFSIISALLCSKYVLQVINISKLARKRCKQRLLSLHTSALSIKIHYTKHINCKSFKKFCKLFSIKIINIFVNNYLFKALNSNKIDKKKRIIIFIGSPLTEDQNQLNSLIPKLNKSKVSLDIICFGSENLDKKEVLTEFIKKVNRDSNLVN